MIRKYLLKKKSLYYSSAFLRFLSIAVIRKCCAFQIESIYYRFSPSPAMHIMYRSSASDSFSLNIVIILMTFDLIVQQSSLYFSEISIIILLSLVTSVFSTDFTVSRNSITRFLTVLASFYFSSCLLSWPSTLWWQLSFPFHKIQASSPCKMHLLQI